MEVSAGYPWPCHLNRCICFHHIMVNYCPEIYTFQSHFPGKNFRFGLLIKDHLAGKSLSWLLYDNVMSCSQVKIRLLKVHSEKLTLYNKGMALKLTYWLNRSPSPLLRTTCLSRQQAHINYAWKAHPQSNSSIVSPKPQFHVRQSEVN